jgi:hypothetical protein
MLCSPLPWSSEKVGGYLTVGMQYFNNTSLEIVHQHFSAKEKSIITQSQYDSINF